MQTNSSTGAVLWFTGLSGAGKSTIATRVRDLLVDRGERVEYLDGDVIRDRFPMTGFTRDARDAHVQRVGYMASRLEHHGVIVICALISPYAAARGSVRQMCRTFVEVHVATPLEECEQRDVKGLYRKARSGEIKNFTGIDDPYEPPVAPEVSIDTRSLAVDESARLVVSALVARMTRLDQATAAGL